MSSNDLQAGVLTLTPWLHPTMAYPEQSNFRYNGRANPIHVSAEKSIQDLMEFLEAAFDEASVGTLELDVSVLWNTKDHKKALNPSEKIGNHFHTGDSFGVYGELMLADFLRGPPNRFAVGTKVLCRTGEKEWDAGKIVELNYRLEPGHTVPYLVELEDGEMTFVIQDIDYLCRELIPPWWDSLLADQPNGNMTKPDLRGALQGKDINERNHKEETALLSAVTLNWAAGVQVLLELKADVNSIDNKGKTALHRCCSHGLSMVELLLEAKANPNIQDVDPEFDPAFTSATFGDHPEHRTPLHYCCAEGKLESAKLLIQWRANLDVQDGQRKTPLHLAIEEDEIAIVDFLLESRAAVDVCSLESGMQNSLLMDAAHKGNHMLAGKLVAAGASVNKVGKQAMAALHLAARRGDPKTVEVLLEAKADTSLVSKCGTALQLASKKGSAELLRLFGLNTDSAGLEKVPLTQAKRSALYMD